MWQTAQARGPRRSDRVPRQPDRATRKRRAAARDRFRPVRIRSYVLSDDVDDAYHTRWVPPSPTRFPKMGESRLQDGFAAAR